MLIAAAHGTVGDIEIVWTLVALIGVGFGVFNLRDALGDKRELVKKNIFNGRRIIAKYSIRAESARITMQTINAIVGILAMFLPEPPPQNLDTVRAWIAFSITWGFILNGCLLLFKSVDAYVTRHRLLGD